jgi:lipid-A-disaccharide synthase
VGHPFFDQLSSQTYDESFVAGQVEECGPLLLLLPGSRNQEVSTHWPILRTAAELCLREHPNLRVAVGCFRESQFEQIDRELRDAGSPIRAHWNRTPELMRAADVCLACSGSVSLELMYHQLPTVIVYRVSGLMNLFKNLFLRCRYITLVNLMASESIERTEWKTFWPDAPGAADVPMPEYLTPRDCSRTCPTGQWLAQPAGRVGAAEGLAGEVKAAVRDSGSLGPSGGADSRPIGREVGDSSRGLSCLA